MWTIIVGCALCVFLTLACSKKDEDPAVAAADPAAEEAPGVGAPPEPPEPADDPVPDPEELPITGDFEEQAEEEITEDNYEDELAKLSDDIEGVPAE
jgi:hypothetical protein